MPCIGMGHTRRSARPSAAPWAVVLVVALLGVSLLTVDCFLAVCLEVKEVQHEVRRQGVAEVVQTLER